MHGDVSFVEIGTTDANRSRHFFAKVFGWPFHPMAEGSGWFQAASMRLGLHGSDPAPQLYTFFEVSDLDQAILTVLDAGGEAEAATEEPGFGRFSICRDPQGIRFGLHQRSAT